MNINPNARDLGYSMKPGHSPVIEPDEYGGNRIISQVPAMTWHDAAQLTLAGKGWGSETRPYERFPSRAEGKIPEKPW